MNSAESTEFTDENRGWIRIVDDEQLDVAVLESQL